MSTTKGVKTTTGVLPEYRGIFILDLGLEWPVGAFFDTETKTFYRFDKHPADTNIKAYPVNNSDVIGWAKLPEIVY